MTVTLVLSEKLADELTEAVAGDVETAGVLLTRRVVTPNGATRLLGRSIHWVTEDAYTLRTATELKIASHGYVPALAAAENDRAVPIWLHTHSGGASPRASSRDRVVDAQLANLFRDRSGSTHYGSVVFARVDGSLAFTGHIESASGSEDIERLWITGRRLTLAQHWAHTAAPPSDMFDRNIRAFGGAIQEVLGDLHVGVVGCGGTGSAVTEQLVRLGVRHLHLFDPKTLTKSNLTRVYGSFAGDIGEPKVQLTAAHTRRIAPDADVTTTQGSITAESAAKELVDADVVFGCTDDNAGRLVLSRLASYFLTPVIDCGVLLSSDDTGQIQGIDGRVTVLVPGAACLVCRDRIDLQRAAAQMLTPSERQQRSDEGYAPALEGVEPAVVTFTTQVAAAAVGELLERLIRYGPDPSPTEILLRAHEREISTNDEAPKVGHYCHPDAENLGIGETTPFLEQAWQG